MFGMLYDLYLFRGSRTLPELDKLIKQAPVLADPDLQKRMVQRSSSPGFLGLDLHLGIAATLVKLLKANKADGYFLPSAYRQPKITVEQALQIATRAIAELHATRIPTHTMHPVRLVREEPVCWTFSAVSEEWLKEGDRVPPALFANVDKLDGHLWQVEDFDRLNGEPSAPPFEHLNNVEETSTT